EIGEKEMMIHNNNVGFHRLLPRECEEASIVILALRAQASLAPRIHARPEIGILAGRSQFRAITGFCLLRPIENGLKRTKFARAEKTFGMQRLELQAAKVVVPTLEVRRLNRPADDTLQQRDVLVENLVLERLRASRYENSPSVQQCGQ